MSGVQGRIRRLAMAGALVALAVVVAYLEQIPWMELQSLVVFAAGYLLGARQGAGVGALAMAFYSAVNPYGFAHPLVFAAQVAGRAAVGVAGGGAAAAGMPRRAALRALVLGTWGVAASVAFDLVTNLATGVVLGQIVPTLLLGLPFALGHLGSNAVLFIVAGGPLLAALEARRMWPALVAVCWACAGAGPARAGDAVVGQAPGDSLARQASGDSLGLDVLADSLALGMRADSLAVEARRESLARAARRDSLAKREAAAARERAALARRERERTYRSGRWAAGLGPAELARRSAASAEDALSLLGAAPRFYERSGAVEPTVLAALPPGFVVGEEEAGALLPRSSPWDEPDRAADGGRRGVAWSALPALGVPGVGDTLRGREDPAAGDAGPLGRGRWRREDIGPEGVSNLSAVWMAFGAQRAGTQGFALHVRKPILGLEAGARWSAWSRRQEELGELGAAGSHGLLLGAQLRGPRWSAEFSHGAERVALADYNGYQEESRGGERTRLRGRWDGQGGAFAGLSAGRVVDRTESSGPVIEELRRAARDLSASAWVGTRLGPWRAGLRAAWLRERMRGTLGAEGYSPLDLDIWWGGAFATRGGAGGALSAALDVETARGRVRVLPRAAWDGAAGPRWRYFASLGGVSATALGEAERLLPESALPAVERPRGLFGQAGVRLDSRPDGGDTSAIQSPPGAFGKGRVRLSLALVGWSASDAVFPAYGLFARDVLLGPAVGADVEGAAAVGGVEWAPAAWAQVGAAGYGAWRSLPAGASVAAPDYRLLLWAGPRLSLFSGSLEVWLAGEADIVGDRVAADGTLPAIVRPGARLALGLGDAWIIGRVTDLDGARHPLPARRFDGERLVSPGRVLWVYGEWRFLD